MDPHLKTAFQERWEKYFGPAPLPMVFFYSDSAGTAERIPESSGHRCLIADLARVRNGNSIAFGAESVSCGGGKRYLGFSDTIRPDFDYFLSYGIPGKVEGERYIRTPEQVHRLMQEMRPLRTGKKYIIFKRWDHLEKDDEPEAVVFFATPDILSGLFTLVNFDHRDGDGVIAPFGAGCASVVYHPWFENRKENPRTVIGMFDVSARPCVPADTLSFAVPMKRFEEIIGYMDESFLITGSWDKVRKRIR